MNKTQIYLMGYQNESSLEKCRNIQEMFDKRCGNELIFVNPSIYNNLKPGINVFEFYRLMLKKIADCDVVLLDTRVFLTNVDLMLIGAVDALNNFGNKHIDIVLAYEKGIDNVPPFIMDAVSHIEFSISDVVDYIINYLLA